MKKIENDIARKLCTPERLPIALEIATKLLKSAMASGNDKAVRELSPLVDDIEAAIEEAKAPPPVEQPQTVTTDKSAKK